ncbi:Auxilin-related protein 2 [Vitis vinifera]|uniref:Auxilin-related protein 2 n=1 Tax=Vitis vinifera TaxID=29760 RepID=A0A438F539_VITVI|nr:Auxilin-related protein 2 [Vitis vinifera]
MNDFSGLLAPDFGYKSQSKSAPMSSSKPSSRGPTRSPWNAAPDDSDSLFSSSSDGRAAPSSSINFDSIFGGSSGSGAKATSSPVYDKPVYDDDIFDGVPGLKTSGSVNYDAFSTVSGSKQKQNDAFDDLLGVLGGRIRSRRDPEMSRMLGLDLMICFMGLVGLVLQVIGFCLNLDTTSIKLLVLKSDLSLLLYVLGQFSIGLISEAH